MRKLQRGVMIRNLVLALVVADGAGAYLLHDRLTKPDPAQSLPISDELIASAARVDFTPQTASKDQPGNRIELPTPAFGKAEPALARAEAAKPAPNLTVPALNDMPRDEPKVAAPTSIAKAPALAARAAPTPQAVAKAPELAARKSANLAPRTIFAPKLAATSPTTSKVATPRSKTARLALASAEPRAVVPSTTLSSKARRSAMKRTLSRDGFASAFADLQPGSVTADLATSTAGLAVTIAPSAGKAEFGPSASTLANDVFAQPDSSISAKLNAAPAKTDTSTELPAVGE